MKPTSRLAPTTWPRSPWAESRAFVQTCIRLMEVIKDRVSAANIACPSYLDEPIHSEQAGELCPALQLDETLRILSTLHILFMSPTFRSHVAHMLPSYHMLSAGLEHPASAWRERPLWASFALFANDLSGHPLRVFKVCLCLGVNFTFLFFPMRLRFWEESRFDIHTTASLFSCVRILFVVSSGLNFSIFMKSIVMGMQADALVNYI